MVTFDPPVSVTPLSGVDPGSIVRWKEAATWRVGFTVISNGDPNRRAIAAYYPGAHHFGWHHREGDLTVLSYGRDIIVRPDVESFAPDLTVTAGDVTLYTLEGAPTLIVMAGNDHSDMRFLNVETGNIESRRSWPLMSGYRTWSAGVCLRDGTFVEVLSVSPRSGSDQQSTDSSDLEPLDP